eukprot:scaffold65756_cov63-Phaeocystis_antarctica.AAC.4
MDWLGSSERCGRFLSGSVSSSLARSIGATRPRRMADSETVIPLARNACSKRSVSSCCEIAALERCAWTEERSIPPDNERRSGCSRAWSRRACSRCQNAAPKSLSSGAGREYIRSRCLRSSAERYSTSPGR